MLSAWILASFAEVVQTNTPVLIPVEFDAYIWRSLDCKDWCRILFLVHFQSHKPDPSIYSHLWYPSGQSDTSQLNPQPVTPNYRERRYKLSFLSYRHLRIWVRGQTNSYSASSQLSTENVFWQLIIFYVSEMSQLLRVLEGVYTGSLGILTYNYKIKWVF